MSARTGDRRRHPERGSRVLRLMDRYVGIPLIAMLRLVTHRRRPAGGKHVQRAAFLHTAAIGDTVLSSAVIQDFRRAYPASRVTFFTGSSNYDIACMIPGVDEVVRLPVTSPLAAIAMIRRSGRFDIWFDLGPWPRLNALYSHFAPASLTVGFRTEGQHRHYLYDIAAPHSPERHEIENYRELLRSAGIRDTASLPVLNVQAVPPRPRNIVVHMFPGGSRSSAKEWPFQRWVELIDLLTGQGYTVSLTGAGSDREGAENVRSRVKLRDRVEIVAGTCSLQEVAGLLMASRLTISVDTGIMHLASALRCNVVSLHGPTSPKRWGPLNENSVALESGMACSPCLSLGFEEVCDRAECMERITVDQVAAASMRFLAGP